MLVTFEDPDRELVRDWGSIGAASSALLLFFSFLVSAAGIDRPTLDHAELSYR